MAFKIFLSCCQSIFPNMSPLLPIKDLNSLPPGLGTYRCLVQNATFEFTDFYLFFNWKFNPLKPFLMLHLYKIHHPFNSLITLSVSLTCHQSIFHYCYFIHVFSCSLVIEPWKRYLCPDHPGSLITSNHTWDVHV